MRYELAQLAQRLKLTEEQLKNPRIISLLEQHLEEVRKIENAPPEMPKKKSLVMNGYRYLPCMEALSGKKD